MLGSGVALLRGEAEPVPSRAFGLRCVVFEQLFADLEPGLTVAFEGPLPPPSLFVLFFLCRSPLGRLRPAHLGAVMILDLLGRQADGKAHRHENNARKPGDDVVCGVAGKGFALRARVRHFAHYFEKHERETGGAIDPPTGFGRGLLVLITCIAGAGGQDRQGGQQAEKALE